MTIKGLQQTHAAFRRRWFRCELKYSEIPRRLMAKYDKALSNELREFAAAIKSPGHYERPASPTV